MAPDFYFQPQIYRGHGDRVLLPPGEFTVDFTRGPEYRRLRREVTIPRGTPAELSFQLERWIAPAAYGFYSGDHHIHGAGCAHYTAPTEGVTPEDMFKQVEGEGLNVGCVLTWGPCFEYQRKFFTPSVNRLSKPLTVMKYNFEISGFGSEALGHVCLLGFNYPEGDLGNWGEWNETNPNAKLTGPGTAKVKSTGLTYTDEGGRALQVSGGALAPPREPSGWNSPDYLPIKAFETTQGGPNTTIL